MDSKFTSSRTGRISIGDDSATCPTWESKMGQPKEIQCSIPSQPTVGSQDRTRVVPKGVHGQTNLSYVPNNAMYRTGESED